MEIRKKTRRLIRRAAMFAAVLLTGLAISCSNGSGSGGTPEPIKTVDVYVSGRSGGKAYVWKNGITTELRADSPGPTGKVYPHAVRSQGKNVYITGAENVSGVTRPLVWKEDGSLHWISTHQWSSAYGIAFYKEKTLVAGKTYDETDSGASLTDITDPDNPVVTFLYKKTPPIDYAERRQIGRASCRERV